LPGCSSGCSSPDGAVQKGSRARVADSSALHTPAQEHSVALTT
jgi:hypothetical protein